MNNEKWAYVYVPSDVPQLKVKNEYTFQVTVGSADYKRFSIKS